MKKVFYIALLVICLISCSKEKVTYQTTIIPVNVQHRINDIYFINQNKGFAIGGDRYDEGYILETLDGGESWRRLSDSSFIFKNGADLQTLNSIDFLDENIGQIVGLGGKILRTVNGGKHWEVIRIGTWDSYYDIQMFSENKTLIVSAGAFADGKLLPSNEFWYNFETEDVEYAIRDIEFIDDNIGFLAGYGTVKKTTNGGKTWKLLDVLGDYFFDLDFIDKNVGFVCGWEGSVFKTLDGGLSWTNIHPQNPLFSERQHFENIDFITEYLGVVCSYNGNIFLTKDGGKSWLDVETGVTDDFHSVYFLNEKTMFAGGENGVLLKISL